MPYFFAITLHELGHAYSAKKCGYKLNKIWILPYGASLNFDEYSFDPKDEIKIAFSGPLVNLLLIFVCVSFWWIVPESYFYTYNFVISNFSIMLFNMIPAYPLDGSRTLIGLLSIKNKRKIAIKITKIFNLIFFTIFFVLFLISIITKINYSFFTISLFMLIGISESKFQGFYSPIVYEFKEKETKLSLPVKHIYVSNEIPIYKLIGEFNKHKFNIVYVKNNGKLKIINEFDLRTLCLFSSPKTKLKDLLK